jgi:uncharacterized protein
MKPFLTAEWRNLIMVNYEVNADILTPYLPLHTQLDSFNGKVYVSLVAFHFLNTKLKGISIPFHSDFEEVNLRFYVRYKEGQEWKRGVVFISELVPKPMIAFVARLLYGEKYKYSPIDSSVKESVSRNLHFSWGKNSEYSIAAETEKKVVRLEEGSEAQFILEHYWGYTSLRNGSTSEYKVAHPSWNIYPVLNYKVDVNFETLYGKRFGFLNHIQPSSVVVAEGSPVAVYDGRTIG